MKPGNDGPAFIQIPTIISRNPDLSHAAKLTYGRLALYAGKDGRCYPKHETLAREVCIQRRQVQSVLDELCAAGWIDWQRTRAGCAYTVFPDAVPDAQKSAHQMRIKLRITCAENCASRCAENCAQKRGIENHHQREVRKDVSPSADVDPVPEDEKPRPFSQKVDDEKPKPRSPLENPEMEFRARVAERHGPLVDADVLLGHVRQELCGVGLTDFLQADLTATTAPGKLTNPHGHYRRLARSVGRRPAMAAMESVFATLDRARQFLHVEQPKLAPTCTCNDGLLPDGQPCCSCRTGKFRKDMAARRAELALEVRAAIPEIPDNQEEPAGAVAIAVKRPIAVQSPAPVPFEVARKVGRVR